MKLFFVIVCALVCTPAFANSQDVSANFAENYAILGLLLMGLVSLVVARRKTESPES